MSKYVEIAKRENNNKRGFLIVNPFLGKHIAKNPRKVLDMFADMSTLRPKGMTGSKTLVIGFAETATALGVHYAMTNRCFYLQTTREHVVGDHTYLYFSEEHSHATAQYIVKDAFERYLETIDRIIFVDDEITTGKTVLNAIASIERAYPRASLSYAVVSILNSMTPEQRDTYDQKGIDVLYVSQLKNDGYDAKANSYSYDGKIQYVRVDEVLETPIAYRVQAHQLPDLRFGMYAPYYYTCVQDLWHNQYWKHMKPEVEGKNVLILGVEETMYAGLALADMMYEHVNRVKFHATTRSPISVSKDGVYPVHKRYVLDSPYEKGRETYVYDLKAYDKVYIVAEASYLRNPSGLSELIVQLRHAGNTDIKVIGV